MNIEQLEAQLRPILSLAQSTDNVIRKRNEDKIRQMKEDGPVS